MEKIKIEALNVENAPAIHGLTFRRYRGTEDHPALIALYNAIYEYANIPERETPEEFDIRYANLRNCNLFEDMILAEANGEVVASGRVWWAKETDSGAYIYEVANNTHPDWGQSGVLEAIQGWLEKRAHQIAAIHPAEAEKYFETWVSESEPVKLEMLRAGEYFEERYFFDMQRDLNQPIPEAVMPEGLEVRPVKPEHYRLIWDASDEAFRDHWGHIESTEEDYQRFLKRVEGMDALNPDLWMVGWEGDQVAGMVLNKIFAKENAIMGTKIGWTDPISVRRPWRKRGLATALILKSLKLLKEHGMDTAALGVDTINPSGALHLYEKCGYKSTQKWITYRKNFNQ
jgi:GNAT superfamily N-acetyltransferase